MFVGKNPSWAELIKVKDVFIVFGPEVLLRGIGPVYSSSTEVFVQGWLVVALKYPSPWLGSGHLAFAVG